MEKEKHSHVMNNMEKRFHFNKKALSLVVTTVILIAFVLVLSSVVFVYVRGIINERTSGAKECFNIIGKISIDSENTCYDNNSKEIQFSIKRGDVDLDEILVSISGNVNSKTFKIKNESSFEDGLCFYGDSLADKKNVSLPSKEGKLTYIGNVSGVQDPYEIELSPKINGKQCEVTDSFSGINSC